VHTSRFAFAFDLMRSCVPEERHLVLEKLFQFVYQDQHRGLVVPFTVLVLNNEPERDLFVAALVQLDAKYDHTRGQHAGQVSLKP
jgi:hypothetical protein